MVEKKPRQWTIHDALVLMYFGGGGVWWLLAKALPWLGVPPFAITLLWLLSYFLPFYLAKKLAPRIK
jgi:hypothetical protein